MKRRLFNLAAAVSLVLCLATVAVWVRSYFERDSLAYTDDIWHGTDFLLSENDRPDRPKWSNGKWHDEWGVSSGRGVLCAYHNRSDTFERGGVWRTKGWHFWPDDPSPWWPIKGPLAWIGLSYAQYGHAPKVLPTRFPYSWAYRRVITFPHWLLVLVTGIMPARMFYRRCQSLRRAGLCPACGYDLRATPQRCPECGAVTGATDHMDSASIRAR